MAISSPGLATGLDVNGIITKLMSIEQQPLNSLNQKEIGFQAQLSAYGSLRGALATFQTAVSGLDSLSKFQALSATSSDTAVVTASTSTKAVAGTHNLNVTQLASAQAIVSGGQSSTGVAIGSGASTTLTFSFGTISGGTLNNGTYTGASFTQDGAQASRTVTIDGTNNSLQGIRDAINSANVGITASIVNDGSGTPYRLTLTNTASGAAHSMRIGVSGDAAIESLLAYDPAGTQNLTQSVTAQDAKFSVNGVSISSASNTVTEALEGITLKLNKAGTSDVVVARDNAGARTAIQAFVKSYNDLNKVIGDLTRFDAGGNSGALIGDAAARTIQARLRDALSNALPGTGTGGMNTLSQAGIAFQRDGTLTIDNTKLTDALNANPDGVAGLFTSFGKTSDSLVRFSKATDSTQAGSYAVNVTTLATQGKLAGAGAANTTIAAGVNDELSVSVDGVSATITLSAGTYTAATLAAQVQAAINGASTLSSQGISVSVTEAAGVLTISSKRYGSVSAVTASGNAANDLLGAGRTSTGGLDVAGTIGGVSASGSGQTLTAGAGTAALGLAVEITGGATGARSNVSFVRGYAAKVGDLLEELLSTTGLLATTTDGVTSSIKDIDRQREALSRRLESIETRYRAQFTALDTLLSGMQSTSNFLAQQLANLPGAAS